MHVHMSLWNGTNNLFFDKNGYALIFRLGTLVYRGADQARAAGAPGVRGAPRRTATGGSCRVIEAPINLFIRSATVGDLAASDVLDVAEGQAARVPGARSVCQPYLTFRRC